MADERYYRDTTVITCVRRRDPRYRPGRTRPFDFRRASHRRIRAQVFLRDDFTCQECRYRPDDIPDEYDGRYTVGQLQMDHVDPRHLGGPPIVDNCQALCAPCNASKGGRA